MLKYKYKWQNVIFQLQGHPNTPLLATSGIDPVVRLWQPAPEDGQANSREVEDKDAAANSNQRRMNADPFETILLNMGVCDWISWGPSEGENGKIWDFGPKSGSLILQFSPFEGNMP